MEDKTKEDQEKKRLRDEIQESLAGKLGAKETKKEVSKDRPPIELEGKRTEAPASPPPVLKVSRKSKQLFTSELALLLEMGVSLYRALQLIVRRTSDPQMVQVIEFLVEQVSKGSTLEQSMRAFPNVFDRYYLATVKAGEEIGSLGESLRILADFMDQEHYLLSKIRSAIMYPAITIGIAGIVLLLLLFFVIPTFADVYLEYGIELPLPTQIVIALSNLFRFHVYFWGGLVVALLALIILQYKYKFIERPWSHLFLKLPYSKELFMKIIFYRFARLMSLLMGAGMSLIDSLKLATESIEIQFIHQALVNTSRTIERGGTLEQGLRNEKIFPDFVVDMIGIGEEIGAVDDILKKISDAYEKEINTFFNMLVGLIEPIFTLTVGTMIAFIALSMFLPYFSLWSGLSF